MKDIYRIYFEGNKLYELVAKIDDEELVESIMQQIEIQDKGRKLQNYRQRLENKVTGRNKKKYIKNREKILDKNKKYYEEHKEERRQYQREYKKRWRGKELE